MKVFTFLFNIKDTFLFGGNLTDWTTVKDLKDVLLEFNK
jgi:hypothetical protein